jgi:hypothetical protein
VDAVARLQLADDVAHVRAHRLDRHAERGADRLGCPAFGHQVHDLALAGRQLRHLGGGPRREQDAVQPRIDVRAAGDDRVNSADQLLHRARLQRVAARPGVQAAVEQLGVGVARVEHHPERGMLGQQLARQLDAAAVGEANVDDRHVRLGVLDQVDSGRDVARGAHDLHPVPAQHGDEALAEGLVVVHDYELGHRWC